MPSTCHCARRFIVDLPGFKCRGPGVTKQASRVSLCVCGCETLRHADNSDLFDLRQNCEQDWDQGSAVMRLNGCKASGRAVFEGSVSAITGMLPGFPSGKT